MVLWYYGNLIYSVKTMVQWTKTMVLWKKLCNYGKNFGNIRRTMELLFTKEKYMIDYQILKQKFDL